MGSVFSLEQRLTEKSSVGSTIVRKLLFILFFAACFFVLQRMTFLLRFPPFDRTTIWTPGALVLSAMLLLPPRQWWSIYFGLCIGAFAAYFNDVAIPVTSAMLAAQIHFIAVAMGAFVIRRFGSNPPFNNLISLSIFSAITVIWIPLCTTAPVDLVRYMEGKNDVWDVALRGFLCVALGMLLATPAITLMILNGRTWIRQITVLRFAEVVVLTGLLAAVCYFCFVYPGGTTASTAWLYIPLPLLLWAASRFGLAGVSWALLLLAYQSTWGAIHGQGPFANQSPIENILHLQSFLMATSLPLMFIATLLLEKKQMNDHFRMVVESTPNAIVMIDSNGTINLVNAQCEKLFGYRCDEIVGKPVEILIPQRYQFRHPENRKQFFANPIVRAMGPGRELFALHKNGHEIPIEIGLTPIQTSMGLMVLSAIVDISERKRANEARRELSHVSRLAIVGELTASIAHEINQPLGAILSNAEAAEMLIEARGVEALKEVRHILVDIRRDDLRASEVIRRLRSLLKEHEIEMLPVNLNEVVLEVMNLIRIEALHRGVQVETNLAAHLPIIRGDKVHLQQVLLNLVLNGIEAMAENSNSKKLIISTVVNDPHNVEVSVADTGLGIQRDRFQRIFDPFFSTKKEGMGLGLSIARSMIEAQGGRIWAENGTTTGATLRFKLPIDAECSKDPHI